MIHTLRATRLVWRIVESDSDPNTPWRTEFFERKSKYKVLHQEYMNESTGELTYKEVETVE